MELSDFQQYHNNYNIKGRTNKFVIGEVRADTEEGREFQDNHHFSAFYKKVTGRFKHTLRDYFGRVMTKSDVIMLVNKMDRDPVLFKMVGCCRATVVLQSIKRPEFRVRARVRGCMVITDQLLANIDRKNNPLTLAYESGKYKIRHKEV